MKHNNQLQLFNFPEDYSTFKLHVQNLIKKTITDNTSGILKDMVFNHFEATGKMIRTLLAYEFSKLTYTELDSLTAWTSSCEILHNATLIHDDIQDRDSFRRGRPTLWTIYGDNHAINAGDFLMLSAIQPVLNSHLPPTQKNQLLLIYSKMACAIVSGQSLEFEINTLSSAKNLYENYIRCITLKTAALFSDLALGINSISHNTPFKNNEVHELFSQLGILFQMHDDIIDLYGDKQRHTKGGDIKEGKVSFLVATHILHYPNDFEILKKILTKPRELTTTNDICYIEELFTSKKTTTNCINQIDKLKNEIFNLDILKNNPQLEKFTSNMINQIEIAGAIKYGST